MSLLKGFIIAFSMYSKIPMPQFPWEERDMRYALLFFPWVGAVIGGLVYLWWMLCQVAGIGTLAYALVGTAIPLLITGGFHADGYMDTCDALHSYKPREEKIRILKDAHIGAFAVLMTILYYLLYTAAFSELCTKEAILILGCGYFLSRTLSGLSVVSFRSANPEGTLSWFADAAAKRIVQVVLVLEGILCIGIMLWIDVLMGGFAVLAALCTFAYYRWKSYREFGGITGDTAGYFVMICELAVVCVVAVSVKIF